MPKEISNIKTIQFGIDELKEILAKELNVPIEACSFKFSLSEVSSYGLSSPLKFLKEVLVQIDQSKIEKD